MTNRIAFVKCLLALLLLNLSACATMESVPVPDGTYAPDAIRPGNSVELVTVAGEEHQFVVKNIDEHGIGGDAGFFPYAEIESLQVKTPGGGAIVLAVVIGIGIAFLINSAIDTAVKTAISPSF